MAKPQSYNRRLQTPQSVKGRIGTLPKTPKPAAPKHQVKVIRKPPAAPQEPEYNPDIGGPSSFTDPSIDGLKEILASEPIESDEPVADPEPPVDIDQEPEPATEGD